MVQKTGNADLSIMTAFGEMAALIDGARILVFGAEDFVDPTIRIKLKALGAINQGPVTSPTSHAYDATPIAWRYSTRHD